MESGLIFNQTHDRGFTRCVMSNPSKAFMFEVCVIVYHRWCLRFEYFVYPGNNNIMWQLSQMHWGFLDVVCGLFILDAEVQQSYYQRLWFHHNNMQNSLELPALNLDSHLSNRHVFNEIYILSCPVAYFLIFRVPPLFALACAQRPKAHTRLSWLLYKSLLLGPRSCAPYLDPL